jgi:hypothetical protein
MIDTVTEQQAPPPAPTPATPPPPIDADITEALRWIAAVSALCGNPDGVEVQASISQVVVLIGDLIVFHRWADATGATILDPQEDPLGISAVAITRAVATEDTTRWEIVLCTHVTAGVAP